MKRIWLGLDGGGTYTRVAACAADGTLLSYVDRPGAASIKKDANAAANVRRAIYEALDSVGGAISDVAGLCAGIAGYDGEDDLEWVSGLTRIEGLNCPILNVNDAVAAHSGAFLARPGIIAISGTGSIIFGINEAGRQLRNYDFEHYASAARFIAIDAVHALLAGEADAQTDLPLEREILSHFGLPDLDALALLASNSFAEDSRERMRLLGGLAPAVTRAAEAGGALAMRVCDSAAGALVTGIRIIGACFDGPTVDVALIGGVATSPYIKRAVARCLSESKLRSYSLREPALPPALGAALLAMKREGIEPAGEVLGNLTRGAESIGQAPG